MKAHIITHDIAEETEFGQFLDQLKTLDRPIIVVQGDLVIQNSRGGGAKNLHKVAPPKKWWSGGMR